MYEEIYFSNREEKKAKDSEWIKKGLTSLFHPQTAAQLYDDLIQDGDAVPIKRTDTSLAITSEFTAPDSKEGHRLYETLRAQLRDSLQPFGHTLSSTLFRKQEAVWRRVTMATKNFYSVENLKVVLTKLSEEEKKENAENESKDQKKEGGGVIGGKPLDSVLMEVGVKSGVSLTFSLLRQMWDQLSWQQKLHRSLQEAGVLGKRTCTCTCTLV